MDKDSEQVYFEYAHSLIHLHLFHPGPVLGVSHMLEDSHLFNEHQ